MESSRSEYEILLIILIPGQYFMIQANAWPFYSFASITKVAESNTTLCIENVYC